MCAAAMRQALRHAPTPHPFIRQTPLRLLGPALDRSILSHARREGHPLTVSELYEFGHRARKARLETRIQSAQWLHQELPVRLAHRVMELKELPYGLATMPSVRKVRDMYQSSFCDLVESRRPRDGGDERDFSEMLGRIRERHDDVVRLMAKGVIELKAHCGRGGGDLEIRRFLDRFYMSRIGIRVLMSHHLELGCQGEGMAGVINRFCHPAGLIEAAVEATRGLSYQHYGEAASVEIKGNVHLKFPYIDAHLFLCLFELLKNSLRATVETHRDADVLPPVRVIVADGKEDVTIKISDEGGGFRRSEMKGVWSYLYTTAKLPAEMLFSMEDRVDRTNRPDPIAGFGYGLPLSRLYARYWGGELGLSSMEGYGTDAYLHLSKLGDKKECLTM
eukprot:GFKZ01007605.1.p1 GENE.GFKZ01007605.1~~GFKZ01007605.1.p1  ORF type:complete len:391 (+),score=53.47 GFKZ01007605.1:98-1270(+)